VLETGSRFMSLPKHSKYIDAIKTIRAGKFRRYHGQSLLGHVFDFRTNLLNIRDLFFFCAGFFQSLSLLRTEQPNAVWIKGGFVGVPIGFACRFLKIPYFTHDSDTVPGLANKLIAKKAVLHAVGMPPDFYTYPKEKTVFTGIPLNSHFYPVSSEKKKAFRTELKIPISARLIVVTGGSLGAKRLNDAVEPIIETILDTYPDVFVFHQTGEHSRNLYKNISKESRKRLQVRTFEEELYKYTGASDIVITRAGATTIAELALQQKACIFIPNPQLTGGQQQMNAEHLKKLHAAVIVTEKEMNESTKLAAEILALLSNRKARLHLADQIGKLAKADAAKQIAQLTASISKAAKK